MNFLAARLHPYGADRSFYEQPIPFEMAREASRSIPSDAGRGAASCGSVPAITSRSAWDDRQRAHRAAAFVASGATDDMLIVRGECSPSARIREGGQ